MGVRRRQKSLEARRAEHAEIDDPTLVMGAALRFLESRARSTSEVRQRLVTTGYRPDLVQNVVERLTELGMLDDDAFARAWVESRDRARPRGERALRAELRQKGVERLIVDAVLEDRADTSADPERPSADEDAARRLLTKNAHALERLADPRVRRQRAYALLARNGFDPDVAGHVARDVLGGPEPPA